MAAPIVTGQNQDDGSGRKLRSMRKSSSVGFGGFIDNAGAQETRFPAPGQSTSACWPPPQPVFA